MGTRVISGDSTYFLGLNLLGQGETARVFPATLENSTGDQAAWAIKLARSQQHNNYIDREYETLVKLQRALNAVTRKEQSGLLPQVKPGRTVDGRKALIMRPLLRHSLLATFEQLSKPLDRERMAVTAARQYADLLQALVRANISCLDRKLGDIWWEGDLDSGHLVVTDWNVVSETPNQVMDLRRFGLLWFELIIGQQMPPDFQPDRRDFDQVQEKLSYALWYIIGRSLGSSMGPQFQSLRELAAILDKVAGFYRESPQTLMRQARANLQKAQLQLDRTKADLAWMQFDVAQRLGAALPQKTLEQAQRWAHDPISEAAPDLIRKLASPNYSDAKSQLQDLRQKAQRPQELGDIERLQCGFDLLNNAKDMLIKARSSSDLTQVAQEFAEVQDLLIEGILQPLTARDGTTAQQRGQRLSNLLPEALEHEGMDRLISLKREASFWVEYDAMQKTMHTQPGLALKALEKTRTAREAINHWPAAYEPTLGDLDRLQTVIESNLREVVLAGGDDLAQNRLQTASAPPAMTVTEVEAGRFWLSLGEDLVKNRWSESLADLFLKLELEPKGQGFKIAIEKVLEQLKLKRVELSESRICPATLSERAGILETFRNLPPEFALDAAELQDLEREQAQIKEIRTQIARDQQELFQNPERILSKAIAHGYELFDDPGLSAAALRLVCLAGRWDNDAFVREAAQLEEQSRHFLTMTNLLEERRQSLEEALTFYTPLAEDPTVAGNRNFLTSTLRLYLSTAQAQIQAEESAENALDRIAQLLEQARPFLPPNDFTTHQNLYEHLLELSSGALPLTETDSVNAPLAEAQLKTWFEARQFEECYGSLSKLADVVSKKQWEIRLQDAIELRKIVAEDEPQPESSFFRRKQNVQNYTESLNSLRQQAAKADPKAYNLYRQEIQDLYERIWQKLDQLDRKSAADFEPTLQI